MGRENSLKILRLLLPTIFLERFRRFFNRDSFRSIFAQRRQGWGIIREREYELGTISRLDNDLDGIFRWNSASGGLRNFTVGIFRVILMACCGSHTSTRWSALVRMGKHPVLIAFCAMRKIPKFASSLFVRTLRNVRCSERPCTRERYFGNKDGCTRK